MAAQIDIEFNSGAQLPLDAISELSRLDSPGSV